MGRGSRDAEMNLSIDPDEDFIKGDHPVSASSKTPRLENSIVPY